MQNFEELYKYLYKKLVDISNAKVLSIHDIKGTDWQACKRYDTVRIAKDAIHYCRSIKEEIKTWKDDEIYSLKVYIILEALNNISGASNISVPNNFNDIYYHQEDTVNIAKNCLKKLNENI